MSQFTFTGTLSPVKPNTAGNLGTVDYSDANIFSYLCTE